MTDKTASLSLLERMKIVVSFLCFVFSSILSRTGSSLIHNIQSVTFPPEDMAAFNDQGMYVSYLVLKQQREPFDALYPSK
jgi:hypothetical protein